MLQDLLDSYQSVSLEQMGKVKLMNRIDTKYVTTLAGLESLLKLAAGSYFIQEIEGRKLMPYSTLYFDTDDCDMYAQHQRGRKNRQKIRVRRYESSGIGFLEVKRKNNKGRTDKKRMQVAERVPDLDNDNYHDFIAAKSRYGDFHLSPQLSNEFCRITMVNNAMTERLTIDINLHFHNEVTGCDADMGPLVIVEVKRDGLTQSPVLSMLKALRIHQSGFSKYCIGMSLTNSNLKANRFKERLRYVANMINRYNKP